MHAGKLRYIEKLTPKFGHIKFGTKVDGSSPPGIFVGRKLYPKVFVGPLVTNTAGDTSVLDTPEHWLGEGRDAYDIAAFRMQLMRGMKQVTITNLEATVVTQMRDIALAKASLDAHAEFAKEPRGFAFDEWHQPFGPSAPLKELELSNAKWEPHMEKAHHDTDLKAGPAVVQLYEKGLLISQIQKAFSVGAFGMGKNRRLVPTRWSITAVDDTLGKTLLDEVKRYEPIGRYRVYWVRNLNNVFVVILTPTSWKYESMEAFFPEHGGMPDIYSDYEYYDGRTTYAQIGGCYYSAKFAVLEQLAQEKKQAGCIILRECYPSYIPLGVWNVRENMRAALHQRPEEFDTFSDALAAARRKLLIPVEKWAESGHVLREHMQQRRLSDFGIRASLSASAGRV